MITEAPARFGPAPSSLVATEAVIISPNGPPPVYNRATQEFRFVCVQIRESCVVYEKGIRVSAKSFKSHALFCFSTLVWEVERKETPVARYLYRGCSDKLPIYDLHWRRFEREKISVTGDLHSLQDLRPCEKQSSTIL